MSDFTVEYSFCNKLSMLQGNDMHDILRTG